MKKKLMSSVECKRRLKTLSEKGELNEKDIKYLEKAELEHNKSEEDMFFNKSDMDYINWFFKKRDRKYIERVELWKKYFSK